MRVAYANMRKSEAHRNAMIRYYKKMVIRKNIAAKASVRAVLLQRRAVKAWKVAVHLRKVAFAKRAAAIKRKVVLVRDAKKWAVKAHGAHVRAKKMNILMIAAKKEMIKIRASYKLWVHRLRKAASAAAKKRAQEKVAQLKIQLAQRVRHHRALLVKEKNLRAIWLRLRKANAVAKRAIVAVVRRTNHWRKVYKTQNSKRIRALKIKAHLMNKAKTAARHMRIAIAAQKAANRRRQLAIRRHVKAVAFRNLQVRLRAKFEKMTKMYRHKYNVSIRFGKKQRSIVVQTRLIKVYLRAARKNMIRRRALQASTRRAHLAVIAARKEHRRQVHLKRRMLARYAVLTARNLRNATIRVNRNKSLTRRAIAARRHFMRKSKRSLRRMAVENAKRFTIRRSHTARRLAARRIARRVVNKHNRIRNKASIRAAFYIRHTVAANKRAQLARLRRHRIIVAARKAAALNAKLICNIRLSASMKRHMFDSEMCQRSKKFLNKLTDEKANPKRLASERQVVKFWCTARNARRAQVAANKKCKSGGRFKSIAMHNENMANVATLAAWGSPAQKKIPKNGKGHISYKAWYAKVMKLASAMSKTPCPVMPGAPAKSLIVHTRHHKSVKLEGGNTMVLTHTNYYYTKPCAQKCKVVKRSVSMKKRVQ
jgi:hypothetical protein